MKFHLFGGLDAPDWILAEIITLSKLSVTKIRVLLLEIVRRILEDGFDYEKVLNFDKDSSLDTSDLKACIATLHFFISTAAKYDVDDVTVLRELQQLGLSKGIANQRKNIK